MKEYNLSRSLNWGGAPKRSALGVGPRVQERVVEYIHKNWDKS